VHVVWPAVPMVWRGWRIHLSQDYDADLADLAGTAPVAGAAHSCRGQHAGVCHTPELRLVTWGDLHRTQFCI
jgi:hypothetical protein